ncbi:MAG: sensor domain-containing diguanylate cyclase [Thiobacillus sp.]|nr:sensor domain-containing diguanylate cyclase [Thiobacillus sp.]
MTRKPGTPPRLVSLRKRFIWLLAGVIGLFAVGMALSLLFSLRTNDAAEDHLLNVEAAQARASVQRRWDYYREVADKLARDPELQDVMLVGSTDEKQQWAISRQRLMPNILGLALVSLQGEVYGDTRLLRLGPSCLRDLRQHGVRMQTQVLIHRDMPGLEHADLGALVHDAGGGALGMVFLSVRLAQLQRIVDESTQPGHAIMLVDAAGNPVVRSGSLEGAVREVSLPLSSTGWTLVAQSPIHRITHSGRLQILAGMLTLAAVLLLLVVVALRMRRPVMQDIDAGLHALAGLTRSESAPPIVTRYVEFASVAADINRIAQQLHDQREQLATLSLTDSLTGLPNRRAFETRFPQAQGLAERQHPVALVMLDIDHFKGVNDRFGHGVGDQVLLALAQSLKELTRRADLAARLAGDEFVVLLSGLDAAGLDAWYQRLSDHFSNELNAYGLDFRTGISAGQTWLGRSSSDTVHDALARADHALYQAKARGRGQLVQDGPPATDGTE